MAQRNDQVFQLSLTEIAFTIAFILLLLLGYLVFMEETLRKAAEAELAKSQSAERATAALNAASAALKTALLGTGVGSPDEVITKLIAVEDVRAERDQLKKRVEDLDAKLTTLEEIRKRLDAAGKAGRPDVTREEVSWALALQEQVRKAFDDAESTSPTAPGRASSSANASSSPQASTADGSSSASGASKPSAKPMAASAPANPDSSASRERKDAEALAKVRQAIVTTSELKKQLKAQLGKELYPGQEPQTVHDIVAAAKGFGELAKTGVNPELFKKENSDLRGQVAFLKKRLDARGGRDYPPCWADEEGKVDFVFSIELKPDQVLVTPAWPPRRETDGRALPGLAALLAGLHSNQEFASRVQGIFNWSKRQNPECRHYVQLKSSIGDAVQSDRARLMVENFFYKTEARR